MVSAHVVFGMVPRPDAPLICECHAARHGDGGCGLLAGWRWRFKPEHTLPSEPGYIDLCDGCRAEWEGCGLRPAVLGRMYQAT